MTYARRPEHRAEGWSESRDSARSPAERQASLRKVTEADYERSREALEGRAQLPAAWGLVTASWLFTRRDSPDVAGEAMAALCAESPPAGLKAVLGISPGNKSHIVRAKTVLKTCDL